MSNDDRPESTVTPDEVGAAAVAFMDGLTEAFGLDGSSVLVDGLELELNVDGSELGLLVGPGGRTLNAVQDLARVAAQRRLGDHETRLRIDVAGYRERREAALAKFAGDVAEQVRTSGHAAFARGDELRGPQGDPRRAERRRRRVEPFGRRRPRPAHHRRPRLITRRERFDAGTRRPRSATRSASASSGSTDPRGDRSCPRLRPSVASTRTCHTVLDLGAGGGVPGLVIAHDLPDLHVTLLDRRAKRTDFLERVVADSAGPIGSRWSVPMCESFGPTTRSMRWWPVGSAHRSSR